MCMCIYIYIHIYTCVYIYIYIYIYVYIYISYTPPLPASRSPSNPPGRAGDGAALLGPTDKSNATIITMMIIVTITY